MHRNSERSSNHAGSSKTVQKRRSSSVHSQKRKSGKETVQYNGLSRTGRATSAGYSRSGTSGSRNHSKGNMNRRRRQSRKKKKGCLGILLPVIAVILILVLLFLGVKSCSRKLRESFSPTVLTDEVLAYESEMNEVAYEEGIEEYTDILLCIMMQETKGKGTDPMQSSECIYNTRYSQTANSIKDPSYSIKCGVKYFADALEEADCIGLTDTNALMLAIQGYNFGHGYISWALETDGGYSIENAEAFSEKMQEELGWSAYGDPEYAVKVMNYYYNSFE